MRKLFTVIGVGVLAASLAVAPSVVAKKGPKNVGGSVTVNVTPSTIDSTTTTVTASGSAASNSGCRKDRIVRFAYVNTTTAAVTPLAETAETKGNGSYTAVLPKPTDAAPATVTLRATVDAAVRKVGSKKKGKKTKKGRRFNCLEITGQSAPLTINS